MILQRDGVQNIKSKSRVRVRVYRYGFDIQQIVKA